MKKTAIQILSLVILTVSFAVVSAHAQVGTRYRASIPFDFSVGKTTFKAGVYTISLADGMSDVGAVLISDAKGTNAKIVLSTPMAANSMGDVVSRLNFNGYDGRYFLSGIATPTFGATFRTSGSERQMGDQHQLKRTTVAIKEKK